MNTLSRVARVTLMSFIPTSDSHCSTVPQKPFFRFSREASEPDHSVALQSLNETLFFVTEHTSCLLKPVADAREWRVVEWRGRNEIQ